MTLYSRRTVLQTALAGGVATSFPLPSLARDRSAPLASTELTNNLFLITGAGANVVAARANDGAVLIDGGTENRSSELLALVTKQTNTKRVTTLLNTHWHPEQTGSNLRVGKAGAKIIAHENTKLWLQRKITVDWRPTPYGPLPKPALPTATTYTTGQLTADTHTVEYVYLQQAHTDGDLCAFFKEANVLVAGGVVSADRWPILDYQTGGWIGGLVAGLDKLIKLADDQTRIVPANGPLVTKADLQAQRTVYFTIYDRLVKALTKGLGPNEAADTQPAKDLNPQWGDARPFVLMAFKSMWGHFAPDA
jgi:glyoxylase-like metal-dependent hydrolase (beta-lactamase superfamily II)